MSAKIIDGKSLAIAVRESVAQTIQTLAARGIGNLTEMLKLAAEKAPLRRNVDPLEVGATAAFLASDAGGGITGEVIHVDCGYHVVGMKAVDAPDISVV